MTPFHRFHPSDAYQLFGIVKRPIIEDLGVPLVCVEPRPIHEEMNIVDSIQGESERVPGVVTHFGRRPTPLRRSELGRGAGFSPHDDFEFAMADVDGEVVAIHLCKTLSSLLESFISLESFPVFVCVAVGGPKEASSSINELLRRENNSPLPRHSSSPLKQPDTKSVAWSLTETRQQESIAFRVSPAS